MPICRRRNNLISGSINQIKDKIKELEQSAKDIEQEIYRIMKNTLKDLSTEFNKKMIMLKSDLLELNRQNQEIEYVQVFIKEQASSMLPINFLKIWTGFKNYKQKLQEQKTTITEMQVTLKLDGKPVILGKKFNFKTLKYS